MKGWLIIVGGWLLSLVLIGSVACNPFGGAKEETTQQLVAVARGDLNMTVSGSGNIELADEMELVFGIGGRVEKILVKEDDEVRQGEVLAQLETDALKLALTQAKVAYSQAQIAVVEAEVAVTQAEVAVTQAQVAHTQAQAVYTQAQAAVIQAQVTLQTAEYELNRAQESYIMVKIKERQVEAAQQSLEAARQSLEAARQSLELAKLSPELASQSLELAKQSLEQAKLSPELASQSLEAASQSLEAASQSLELAKLSPELARQSLEAASQSLETTRQASEATKQSLELAKLSPELASQSLELAKQSLEQAQKQLDKTTLIAPFAGVVARLYVDEGDTVSPTTTILYLINPRRMELKVRVDEIDIPQVKVGQRAIIELDALPNLPLEGTVSSISWLPTVEAGVIMYDVKINLGVAEGTELRAGMSATADIVINERHQVLLVPNRAIKLDSQGNPLVEVMAQGQIKSRAVVIGISDDFQTEIVSGLSEGEVVVIEKKTKTTKQGSLFP